MWSETRMLAPQGLDIKKPSLHIEAGAFTLSPLQGSFASSAETASPTLADPKALNDPLWGVGFALQVIKQGFRIFNHPASGQFLLSHCPFSFFCELFGDPASCQTQTYQLVPGTGHAPSTCMLREAWGPRFQLAHCAVAPAPDYPTTFILGC